MMNSPRTFKNKFQKAAFWRVSLMQTEAPAFFIAVLKVYFGREKTYESEIFRLRGGKLASSAEIADFEDQGS